MQPPEVSYASNGDVAIVYQAVGAGSPSEPLFDGLYECCKRALLLGREPS